jgi:hypothetical protein
MIVHTYEPNQYIIPHGYIGTLKKKWPSPLKRGASKKRTLLTAPD